MIVMLPFMFGLVLMAGMMAPVTAVAPAGDIEAYQGALGDVCRVGVTSELTSQYQRSVAAVDRQMVVEDYARVWPGDYDYLYGENRTPATRRVWVTGNPRPVPTDNFWGPTPPDLAYTNCRQGS